MEYEECASRIFSGKSIFFCGVGRVYVKLEWHELVTNLCVWKRNSISAYTGRQPFGASLLLCMTGVLVEYFADRSE